MTNRVDQFLAAAKRVSLTQHERTEVRSTLVQTMTLRTAAMRVHLSDSERAEGRGRLAAFMKIYPVLPSTTHNTGTGFFDHLRSVFSLRLPALVSIAGILVLIGGSAVYAAESALPGDIFYPLKVDILEALHERLLWNPQTRADWIIRRIERRIEETKKLSERRSLDAPKRAQIESRLQKHIEHLDTHLAKLNDTNKERAFRTKLETRLALQEKLLERGESDAKPPKEVQAIIRSIRQKRGRVHRILQNSHPDRKEKNTIPQGKRIPKENDVLPRDPQSLPHKKQKSEEHKSPLETPELPREEVQLPTTPHKDPPRHEELRPPTLPLSLPKLKDKKRESVIGL